MDVVVIGSCNIDLISYVSRLPKPGETLLGYKFSKGFGGKGANQCIAASRLGAKTAMIAMVGTDSFGEEYIKNLKENGANTEYVFTTSEASTGVAPIAVDDEGQNAIIVVSGANMLLSSSEVTKAESMIASAKIAVFQLEISPDTTLAGMKLARKYGVKTILNPAPAQTDLDPEMYSVCDIFCPNETEAELLTGFKINSPEDAHKAIGELLSRGCQTVIITLGKTGSVFASQDNPSPVLVPASTVTPVDSTGAGDAFVGALAYYLVQQGDQSLQESIKRAGQIATYSVLSPGTQTSYKWKKELPQELFS